MKNKRIAGLDIIRSIAIFTVIAVHYLFNTNFYNMKLHGGGMIILSGMRHFLMICVPLFLLLTGYLNSKKEPTKEYYLGITKVLKSYIFISIICIFARAYIFKESHSIYYWIESIFSFRANGYSWYIEMFIGLYIIIPYLNILYKSLEIKKKKSYLIFVLITITIVPSILNGTLILGERVRLLPDWWVEFYPITYYFIGAYLKEYQPKLSTIKNIIYIGLTLLIQTSIYYLINEHRLFYKDYLGRYHSIFALILSVLVFLLFYQRDIKNKFFNKLTGTISVCSLDMYLLSYIIDIKVYQYIKPLTTNPKEHLIYMIPTIIFIFICAFILAYIKKILFDWVERNHHEKKLHN